MVIQWEWLCRQFKVNGNAWFPLIAMVRDKEDLRVVNHEKIHVAQQKELLYVGFILLYIFYQIKYGYLNNPFELEARKYQYDQGYLNNRKLYAWYKIEYNESN